MFKVISLFAGCGGSSLGYKLAGCDVVAAVEFDSHAAAVYRENFPNTHLIEGDIAIVDPCELMSSLGLAPGDLDILDGSPPCQGFSMVGQRRGNDTRNYLFAEYIRFLKAIQPKAFVMENVVGLTKGRMRGIFAEIIRQLSDSGYFVQARVLNAVHYGVPQNRQRVIILGIRQDLDLIPEYPTPSSTGITFRQATKDLKDLGLIQHPVGPALALSKALQVGESGASLHRRYRQKPHDFSLIRLAWDKPAPTVCKTIRPGQCGLLHPEEDRFLSIGELKRICAFPDDFVLFGKFEQQWGRLGNAVPPLLTQAVAHELIKQLEGGA